MNTPAPEPASPKPKTNAPCIDGSSLLGPKGDPAEGRRDIPPDEPDDRKGRDEEHHHGAA